MTFFTLPFMSAHSKSKVLHIGWKPPPFRFHKLNTDGFAKGNPGLASAGSVIRDHRGSWIGSFNRAIGHTHSLAAKLWGLRDGLSIARSLNIKKLLIKTDAQAAVNIILLLCLTVLTHHTLIMVSFRTASPSSVILRKLACTTFTTKQTIVRIFWLKKERLILIPLFPTPILLVFCTSS